MTISYTLYYIHYVYAYMLSMELYFITIGKSF